MTTIRETNPPERYAARAFLDRDSIGERALTFTASATGTKRDRLLLDIAGISTDNFEANPVFLWAHDYSGRTLPIGKVTKLRKLSNRIDAVVEFDESDEFAQRVEKKYRDGFLNAVSIGWNILSYERGLETDDFDFRVTESDLLDISAVPVPGDPQALIKTQRDLLASDGFVLEEEFTLRNANEENEIGDSQAVPDTASVTGAGDETTDEPSRIDELAELLEDVSRRLDELTESLDSAEPIGDEPDTETLAALAALRDLLATGEDNG